MPKSWKSCVDGWSSLFHLPDHNPPHLRTWNRHLHQTFWRCLCPQKRFVWKYKIFNLQRGIKLQDLAGVGKKFLNLEKYCQQKIRIETVLRFTNILSDFAIHNERWSKKILHWPATEVSSLVKSSKRDELLTIVYKFRINGLKVIIISDREGVPLLKLSKDNKFPELGTKQNFLSTFSVANEQSSKMLLGRNKSIICMYKSTLVSCSNIFYEVMIVISSYYPFLCRLCKWINILWR